MKRTEQFRKLVEFPEIVMMHFEEFNQIIGLDDVFRREPELYGAITH